MKTLKHDIKLAEKYKAWKKYCAQPYSKHRNARDSNRENNKEINKKIRQTLKVESPLKATINEIIPVEIREQLNKMR